MTELVKEELELEKAKSPDTQPAVLMEAPSKKSRRDDDMIFSFVEESSTKSSSGNSTNAVAELSEYLAEPLISRDTNPLTYWKAKEAENRFPTLCRMARKYLAFPASSGSVERLFSIAGAICRSRRARITMKTLSNILLYRDFRASLYDIYS